MHLVRNVESFRIRRRFARWRRKGFETDSQQAEGGHGDGVRLSSIAVQHKHIYEAD